ncbi:MAG TPA: hypothetical protein PKA13_19370 [Geminicoccaceae bacterium]|nr:hypothetical protein [Geminicoccus sp.]HMU51945.1 hypothetical protein [Geminicoccaceae bacterium]
MVDGIGGSFATTARILDDSVGTGDIHQVLMTLGIERASITEQAVKTKIATIRENNAKVQALNSMMSTVENAPRRGPDTADLKAVGEQMAGWGSAGGRSWMSPDFKDTLDKYGVEHKASNMTKESMSTSSGGWTVSYPTSEYHQLGKDVQQKAADIAAGKDPKFPPDHIDLAQTVPNSNPPVTYQQALEKAGIEWGGGTLIHQDKLKDLRGSMDLQVKSMTSNDQLDMIELQSLVGKQTNAVEVVSTMVKKKADQDDSVVRKW